MQTWKNTQIPDHWQSGIEAINRIMVPRGWKWHLMTDEDNKNFISKHFPDFVQTYESFRYPIQRADAIRACYLYVHGGVYMDLDFEIQDPIDELFHQGQDIGLWVVPSGNLSNMFTNAFMASTPKNPFWLEYIEEMKKPAPWYGIGKHLHVMTTTGPMALTRTLRQTQQPYVVLPSKLVTPCSVCDLTCENIQSSYLKQLQGGSWNGFDSNFYNWAMCNWTTMLGVFVIFVIIIILLLIG